MATDQQVRERFLEESGEYFEQMEQVLLGLPDAEYPAQQIDVAMRAAHSLKGGAGMMGFTSMAQVAHRLEDFLKIIRARSVEVDTELETLLLRGVDSLKAVRLQLSTGLIIDDGWMARHVEPIVEQLRERLGELSDADENRLLSEEENIDAAILVFNGGVEEALDTFEANLDNYAGESLRESLCEQANCLSELGLMGGIDAFVSLCQSVHVQAQIVKLEQISMLRDQALAAWRRSQSLVQLGRLDKLPTQLEFVPDTTTAALQSTLTTNMLLPQTEAFEVSQLQAAFDQFEVPNVLEPSEPGNLVEASDTQPLVNEIPVQSSTLTPPSKHSEAKQKTVKPQVAGTAQPGTLRIAAEDLQQISALFGTLILERNAINLRQKQLNNIAALLQKRMQELEAFNVRLRQWYDRASMESLLPSRSIVVNGPVETVALRSTRTNVSSFPSQDFDALEMDQYSELHLIAQEQMETVVKLQEVTADIRLGLREMGQNTQALNGTTRKLQNRITRTQMRPISDVLSRFPRLIRDLSVQYNKKVQLKIEGETTLFERLALDSLTAPLTHILRNSFDHGIESNQERIKAGKPEVGLITIHASQLGNRAQIIIRDDGNGINLDKIRDRIRNYNIDEAVINKMSEQELLSIIFDAGFSTADKVTELSGRGMGMDVVRTNLEKLGGNIQVDTQLGQGTTFTIEIPLSLSVLRIMLLEQQSFVFAIPVDAIEELTALDRQQIIESDEGTKFNWQGQQIPWIKLDDHLTFNSKVLSIPLDGQPTINCPMALIISHDDSYYAIEIQRYWGEQEVATCPISSPIPLPSSFVGATILGDGRVVPLIDLPLLISSSILDKQNLSLETETALSASRPCLQHNQLSQHTVLVVDDSVHLRRHLTLCLEKAGYYVEQARDGQEAVKKILGGLNIHAVLCDVEMPRLDGYGVLDEIKTRPEFKSLPISMLTSRSSEKHRQLAMNLGASAYFAKPYNEQELLKTLKKLIIEAT